MAEHAVQDRHLDLEAHQQTYAGFIRGSVALVLMSIFVMVALVSFAFGAKFSVLIGFLGMVVGAIAVLIDTRAGSKNWLLSIAALVVFALVTAINVS